MFEVDYPHSDSTWPDSRAVAAETMAGLDPDVVHKLVRGNAIRLFGLHDLPESPTVASRSVRVELVRAPARDERLPDRGDVVGRQPAAAPRPRSGRHQTGSAHSHRSARSSRFRILLVAVTGSCSAIRT